MKTQCENTSVSFDDCKPIRMNQKYRNVSNDSKIREYKELINVDGVGIIQIDHLIKHLFYEMIRHFYVANNFSLFTFLCNF